MKTSRLVALARIGRDAEKKTKKPTGHEEFSNVLAAVPLPLPKPASLLPIAKEEPAKKEHKIAAAPHPSSALGVNGAPVRDLAPAAPTAPAAFVAQLPEDPGLRVTVAPTAAAITIQTPDAGDLSLYLRVRQGTAELRVEGPAAPVLEHRTDELRMVLATEGITLRHVEITPPSELQNTASFSSERDAQHQHQPPEPFEADDRRPSTGSGRTAASSAKSSNTLLSVKA